MSAALDSARHGAPIATSQRSLSVLVVIELGANWGHLLRILPAIRELKARGHRPVLAVADVDNARTMVDDLDLEVVRTPGALVQAKLGAAANMANYAQILDRCVFGDDATLAETLAQWRALLEARRPDVILADFSPAALLVAHLHRLPLVRVNSGWEVPPFQEHLPIIRPWLKVDVAALKDFESTIVERLNRCCVQFGAAPYGNFGDLYAGGTQLLGTFAETDHFGPRQMNYIGPVVSVDRGLSVSWKARPLASPPKRILVYLAEDSRNVVILEGLKRLNVDVIAVLPGIRKESTGRFSGSNIRVWDQPVRLDELMSGADLVINNGGHGLIAASLLAGVPLLIQPQMIEQSVITRRLQEGGLAHLMANGPALLRCAQQVASILENEAARAPARAVAKKYAGHTQLRTLLSIVDAVELEAEKASAGADPST